MKKSCKAEGGGISKAKEAETGPHEEQTNKKKTEKMEHPDEYKGKDRAEREVKVEKKKGGRVHRKHGGMVHGEKPKHRLDKRARSGAAKSPLSGANVTEMPYTHGNLGVNMGGKGKTVKA